MKPQHFLFVCLFYIANAQINGYDRVARADPQRTIETIWAVKQQNLDILEQLVWDVSDPTSNNYGRYRTLEEITEITAPSAASLQRVYDMIEASGGKILHANSGGSFLKVAMSVADVEKTFGAEMHHWVKVDRRGREHVLVRSESMQIPEEIADDVDFIHGISGLYEFEHHINPSMIIPSAPATASNAPSLWYVMGGDSGVSSIFTPNCKDGTVIANYSLCENSPPQIAGFDILIMNPSTGVNITAPAPVMCNINYISSNLACTASYFGLENWENVVVGVRTKYEDDSMSEYAISSLPVFPHPFVTPGSTREIYSIAQDRYSCTLKNATQSVPEFGEYFSQLDISQYLGLTSLPNSVASIVGYNDPTIPGIEASLDTQMAMSIGVDCPTTVWNMNNSAFLTEWIMQVADDPNPPLVHSISYGEPEDFLPLSYADRVNVEFQKLAVRGVTIITTSGDVGIADGVDCTKAHADFPSSSPFTTSVGATRFAPDITDPICDSSVYGLNIVCSTTLTEVPCTADGGSAFTTGGSFSSFFNRPKYQNSAVTAYINSITSPPTSYFNTSGRAYNDLTLLGDNVLIVYNGTLSVVGGTSASGPILAGIVSLINNARMSAGKPPVGFFNPLLYFIAEKYPEAFNPIDATNYDNSCSFAIYNGPLSCCPYGFVGTKNSWNPLTGLGSPNVDVLIDVILGL